MRPHSHGSSSSSSIIPPITFEGRGQGRTLNAERVSGGGAPSICIFPTFLQLLLLLLLLPLLSLRGLTLTFPFWLPLHFPQSILTHPVYKTLSQQPPLLPGHCYFPSHSKVEESLILGLKEVWLVAIFAWAMSSRHILSILSSCLQRTADCRPCHSLSMFSAQPAGLTFLTLGFLNPPCLTIGFIH